jgi:large subunit ribosomal protein L25
MPSAFSGYNKPLIDYGLLKPMQIALECQKRSEKSNPNSLRRQGLIPAVLYGHNGTESVSLTLKEKDAYTLLKKASVNNTLIDINIPEMPWNGKALIREVQSHPWKKTLYHLSFFSVATHGKIEVAIPVRLEGNSVGVKGGGILEHMITEIKVQCAPESIPESVTVNISELDIGQSITVGELVLPEGLTALEDPEQGVIAILSPGKA